MWMKLYLAVCAALLIGTCSRVLAHGHDPLLSPENRAVILDPSTKPQMRLYTPGGYETRWWIFQEIDGSCVVIYSVYEKGSLKDQSQVPCEMFGYFFKSITKRPGA